MNTPTSPSQIIPGRKFGQVLLAGLLSWPGFLLHAQVSNQVPPPVSLSTAPSAAKLGPEELSELLAPIALYPDALIAIILPAATTPSDVVLGSRFLDANRDISLVDNQPWDESVKSLTRYPEVLAWMNDNLEWTAAVGEAFVEQPADVMNALQALRAKARAAGNLVDTPQQKVVIQEEVIRIVPADPEIIYVPQYDPEVIYVETYQPSYTPFITFGVGFAVGSWLNYDFDWNRRCVYRGNWRGWNDNNWNNNWNNNDRWNNDGSGGNNNAVNNNVNVVNINNNNVTQWQPSENSRRQVTQRQRNNSGNARFNTPEARAERAQRRAQRQADGNNSAANRQNRKNDDSASTRPGDLPRPERLDPTKIARNRDKQTDKKDGNIASVPPGTSASPQDQGRNRDRQLNADGNASKSDRPTGSPIVTYPNPPGTQLKNGKNQPDPSNPPGDASNGGDRSERSRKKPTAPPNVPGQLGTVAPNSGGNSSKPKKSGGDSRSAGSNPQPLPAPLQNQQVQQESNQQDKKQRKQEPRQQVQPQPQLQRPQEQSRQESNQQKQMRQQQQQQQQQQQRQQQQRQQESYRQPQQRQQEQNQQSNRQEKQQQKQEPRQQRQVQQQQQSQNSGSSEKKGKKSKEEKSDDKKD